MILTTDQALSFVDAASKGAPKHFFDALLGAGRTPKIDDFKSDDVERLEKAEEFLECVQSVTDALVEHLSVQQRQASLLGEFDKHDKKPPKKKEKPYRNFGIDQVPKPAKKKKATKKPTKKKS